MSDFLDDFEQMRLGKEKILVYRRLKMTIEVSPSKVLPGAIFLKKSCLSKVRIIYIEIIQKDLNQVSASFYPTALQDGFTVR